MAQGGLSTQGRDLHPPAPPLPSDCKMSAWCDPKLQGAAGGYPGHVSALIRDDLLSQAPSRLWDRSALALSASVVGAEGHWRLCYLTAILNFLKEAVSVYTVYHPARHNNIFALHLSFL